MLFQTTMLLYETHTTNELTYVKIFDIINNFLSQSLSCLCVCFSYIDFAIDSLSFSFSLSLSLSCQTRRLTKLINTFFYGTLSILPHLVFNKVLFCCLDYELIQFLNEINFCNISRREQVGENIFA